MLHLKNIARIFYAALAALGLAAAFVLVGEAEGGSIGRLSQEPIPEDYARLILPNRRSQVVKWPISIRLVVVQANSPTKTKEITLAADRILLNIKNRVREIDIDLGNDDKKNLIIFPTKDSYRDLIGRYKNIIRPGFSSEDEFNNFVNTVRNDNPTCVSYTKHAGGRVFLALIMVDEDLHYRDITKCFSVKTLNILGVRGKSTSQASVVSHDAIIMPTDFDYRALKLLYSKKVEPGDYYIQLRAKISDLLKRGQEK